MQQRGELCPGPGRGASGERARRGGRLTAQVQERPHHRRGRHVLALAQRVRQAAALGPGHRIEVAVQHHVPDGGREQVGVDGAEPGGPGQAKVVQLADIHRLAQQVHVTGHIRAGVVPEQAAVLPGAQRVEPRPRSLPERDLPRAHRKRRQAGQELVLGGGIREAAHRAAKAEPAHVEGDDVEPRPQRGGNGTEFGQDGLDLLGGTTRVDEKRTGLARAVGRQVPDHRNADRRAARVPVVQRHPRCRALEAVIAGRPAQPGNARSGCRGGARGAGGRPRPAGSRRASGRGHDGKARHQRRGGTHRDESRKPRPIAGWAQGNITSHASVG